MHWLVTKPVTQNPLKLDYVYSVVRDAIKHKHPECRSAFTYCEDEPPHIDLSNYGHHLQYLKQAKDVKNIPTALGFGRNKDSMDIYFGSSIDDINNYVTVGDRNCSWMHIFCK